MSGRMTTEYRLLVQRQGNAVSDKRFYSMAALTRRIGLLTSPEPWKFYGKGEYAAKGPDDYVCCADGRYDECGCGGLTMRQQTEERRRDLPPIESIRVQVRRITKTPWETLDVPESFPARLTDSEKGKALGSAEEGLSSSVSKDETA